ncbi:MAG: class I SAM-dependent methyltransferase [Dehalococcoidia bacterium]|nr:class I SAM-dependent methyltransferase [Dehalococcoidia bacterium]
MAHDEDTLGWRLMALSYKVRDALRPRGPYLEEAGVSEGMSVLDFGCGPGSYVVPAAQMVTENGRIYALDIRQTALTMVRERTLKLGISNVETILSDCDTGLPAASIDVVLLYDIYHDLAYPAIILAELHRVIKPEGILSAHDHHLSRDVLKRMIETGGLFRATGMGARTLKFAPERKDA